MDLGEKLFGVLATWSKRLKSKRQSQHAAFFDSEINSIQCLFFSICPSQSVVIRPALTGGEVRPDEVLLPDRIDYFTNQKKNRLILLHKTLVAATIHRNHLTYSAANLKLPDRIRERSLAMPAVISSLKIHFPNYLEFFDETLPLIETLDDRLSCDLMIPKSKSDSNILAIDDFLEPKTRATGQDQNKVTEKERRAPNQIDYVHLDPKNENPVMHSFEKLETADNYHGGVKVTDGSDELQKHQNALDELELNHVTRDGETAASIYRAQLIDLLPTGLHTKILSASTSNEKLYPEWDYRKQKLIQNHCKLNIKSSTAVETVTDSTSSSKGIDWMQRLNKEYGSQIQEWEGKLWQIVNQKKWEDRQWEGSELSIDAYTRYYSDVKNHCEGDARLFLRQVPLSRDIAVLILMDQSFSTDGWVENRRVIDVERDAVGLVGMLLKDIPDAVCVAGTWSHTRSNCHFEIHKSFNDPWTKYYDRAVTIEPAGHTRLGPAIRHSTELLHKTGAKKKILILLTDGKPTDFDRYEGRYGMEDIHHSFLEAKQKGVSIKALAIEIQARYYFPLLFGKTAYHILNDPGQLPGQLFKIYLES